MALGDATQIGEVYLIGIGNTLYESHTIKSVGISSSATETEHMDARGAVDSVLIQNPAVTLDLTVDLVGASTEFTPPLVGDLVSVKAPDDTYPSGYRVKSANSTPSDGVATMDLSLVLEDSMGATFDDGSVQLNESWDISEESSWSNVLIMNGATSVESVYGNSELLTVDIDYEYTGDGELIIDSDYIGGIIQSPGNYITIKICMNYGPVLGVQLTGTA